MEKNHVYQADCISFMHTLCNAQKEMKQLKLAQSLFEQLLKEKAYPSPTILYMKQLCIFSNFSYFIFIAAFVYEIDIDFMEYCFKSTKVNFLSSGILIGLYSSIYPLSFEQLSELYGDTQGYRVFQDSEMTYTLQKKIILKKDVLYYLLNGCIPLHANMNIYMPCNKDYAAIYQSQFERLQQYHKQSQNFLLIGGKGCGKTTLIKRYCEQEKIALLSFDLRIWSALSFRDQRALLDYVIFFRLLTKGIFLLSNIQENNKEACASFFHICRKHNTFVIGSTLEDLKTDLPFIELPYYLSEEDANRVSQYYGYSNWGLINYHVNPDDIKTIYKNGKENQTVEQAYQKIMNQSMRNTPYYTIVKTKSHFIDWFGQEELKEQLLHIAFIIDHRNVFDKQMEHTKGAFTILFHGPSGTGKSFAASIIGNETGLPIWQINLANILDKFIGESEKHLQKIFREAEKQNCILLFDEADALFGKRTAIHNSNDKYSNNSTAFLLQQMEAYHGIIILTSNVLNNFDDAFLRRIQFIIRFPLCDENTALVKWKQCFTYDNTRNEIPFGLLAQHLYLSLAQIENVYRNACFYQLEEEKESLERKHIYRAIMQEYQKKQERLPDKIVQILSQ